MQVETLCIQTLLFLFNCLIGPLVSQLCSSCIESSLLFFLSIHTYMI
jgi:hypothetical protein